VAVEQVIYKLQTHHMALMQIWTLISLALMILIIRAIYRVMRMLLKRQAKNMRQQLQQAVEIQENEEPELQMTCMMILAHCYRRLVLE